MYTTHFRTLPPSSPSEVLPTHDINVDLISHGVKHKFNSFSIHNLPTYVYSTIYKPSRQFAPYPGDAPGQG